MTLVCSALVLFLSACGPKMRIKPGEIPAAEIPTATLTTEAEGYVSAHINQGNYEEIRKGAELKRVKNVVERLARGAGYPPNIFPVHLVDAGEEVNAAAVDGASIIVYKKLLERVHDDEDLATVLGHEIGHIIAKHYTDEKEEKSRAQAVQVGSTILGLAANIATSAAGYGGSADLAGSVTEGAAGALGYGAFVGSFNRTQEYEADHLGLMIMAKAGYNPEKAIDFWGRADEVFGSSSTSVGSFFSTHPASGDRLNSLREALPLAMNYYHPAAAMPPETSKPKAKKGKKK